MTLNSAKARKALARAACKVLTDGPATAAEVHRKLDDDVGHDDLDNALRWLSLRGMAERVGRRWRLTHDGWIITTGKVPDPVEDPVSFEDLRRKVAEYIRTHPGTAVSAAGREYGFSNSYVAKVARALLEDGLIRKTGNRSSAAWYITPSGRDWLDKPADQAQPELSVDDPGVTIEIPLDPKTGKEGEPRLVRVDDPPSGPKLVPLREGKPHAVQAMLDDWAQLRRAAHDVVSPWGTPAEHEITPNNVDDVVACRVYATGHVAAYVRAHGDEVHAGVHVRDIAGMHGFILPTVEAAKEVVDHILISWGIKPFEEGIGGD